MKYIVVTGGVISGIGKGIAAASIANLITKNYNLKVIPIKCDGYLNTDPGTMNPIEHGEVFVMEDGTEVDMDFGHYERFMNINTKKDWNFTMGKIFLKIINNEREGKYLGKTVQFIPHVTDEILERFIRIPKEENADLCIIEIGGTIGDMENMFYVEAVRQLKRKVGQDNLILIHLTYVPEPSHVGEQKTKPTQQSVNLLMNFGLFPDFILARAKKKIKPTVKDKIALFSNIDTEFVISAPDESNIYEIPINFHKEKLDEKIGQKLNLKNFKDNISNWEELVKNMNKADNKKNIVIAGKYTDLQDSYASIIEAIKHASAHLDVSSKIDMIDTTNIDYDSIKDLLKDTDAVIVPGGFGKRGIEGKIEIIRYCRENNIPFLGICYGLQLAVIEFARNVCNIKDANTTEVEETNNPIIDILEDQKNLKNLGGTMRLGSYEAYLDENSLLYSIYKSKVVSERHRHRYEVNPKYHDMLEKYGLNISGKSENGRLAEFIELKNHKFFVATQAHPELKSRFESPTPLFLGLIKSTL